MTLKDEKHWMHNKSERKWVYGALVLAIVIVVWGIWNLSQFPSTYFQTKEFKFTFKKYGAIARLALFVVLSHYAFSFIFQKRLVDQWTFVKKWMITLSRLVRKWHTPVSILAIALILLHAIGAFLYGIKLDFQNVSGLLALCALLPVPISGILRYRKLDKTWHLRLGLTFAVLFLLHAFL